MAKCFPTFARLMGSVLRSKYLCVMLVELVRQVREIIKNDIIMQNSQDLFNITNTTGWMTRQDNSPPDLRMISFPPGRQLPNRPALLPRYQYQKPNSHTQPSRVYVIDKGVRASHRDFRRRNKRWIFTRSNDHVERDEDDGGHGTCVASKAVGNKYGVARDAELVIVKTNYDIIGITIAFINILSDLRLSTYTPRSNIIVISLGTIATYTPAEIRDIGEPWASIIDQMREILAMQNVVIVTAAGNYADRSLVTDTLPGMLTTRWFSSTDLVVVSALTLEGRHADFSQVSFTGRSTNPAPFYAPGQDVVCAGNTGDLSKQTVRGTSFATPLVGGFIAYSWGLDNFIDGVPAGSGRETLLTELSAKARRSYYESGGPLAIWNRQDPFKSGAAGIFLGQNSSGVSLNNRTVSED